MDNLRLILLTTGVVVVAAIYIWTRFQQKPRKRIEPGIAGVGNKRSQPPDSQVIEQELARMGGLIAAQGDVPESSRQHAANTDAEQMIVVSVVAGKDHVFHGENLGKAFEHNQLSFGEHAIVHRMSDDGGRAKEVYAVANMVKPGTFPQHELKTFTTSGVTMFLQLPGPLEGVVAFDDLINTAQRLAVELGGELEDQQHERLSQQQIEYMRERIVSQKQPVSGASVH